MHQRPKASMSLLASVLVIGCASPPPHTPRGDIRSTQGTTLVRNAQVVEVTRGRAEAVPHDGVTRAAVASDRVTVRFENGQTGTYEVPANTSFRPGDTVRLITDRDGTRLLPWRS